MNRSRRRDEESGTTDTHALAALKLEAERPLRSARLRAIAASLAEGRADFAREELARYLAKHPDDADALCLSAQAHLRAGRREEALAGLARALELAPEFPRARFERPKLLFALDRFP